MTRRLRLPRLSAVVAWSLAAMTLMVLVGAPILLLPVVEREPSDPMAILAYSVLLGFSVFAIVGALVASHHPRNPIGWALIVIALSFTTSIVLEEYFNVAPLDPFPGVEWVALVAQVFWVPFVALVPIVVLVFPDGRLPSPRWRPYLAAHILFFGVRSLADLGAPQLGRPQVSGIAYGNPLPFAEVLAAVGGTIPDFGPLYALWFGVPVVALIQRLRRSGGAERQQLKWLVFAAAIVAMLLSAFAVLSALGLTGGGPGDALFMLVLLSYTLVPVSIGIAILRYRLYEIDVLMNRALVYGALSATLAAAYMGTVLALQTALRPFTAGSDIAVAVSTLAVVALFQPLRRRIQDAVDRRFYRSRYDAQRTLDAFAARLRDETDLGTLEGELLSAVDRALRPARVSVWLRAGGATAPRA